MEEFVKGYGGVLQHFFAAFEAFCKMKEKEERDAS